MFHLRFFEDSFISGTVEGCWKLVKHLIISMSRFWNERKFLLVAQHRITWCSYIWIAKQKHVPGDCFGTQRVVNCSSGTRCCWQTWRFQVTVCRCWTNQSKRQQRWQRKRWKGHTRSIWQGSGRSWSNWKENTFKLLINFGDPNSLT